MDIIQLLSQCCFPSSVNYLIFTHMQGMQKHQKYLQIYLRRRHRLIRAINQSSHLQQSTSNDRQTMVELFEKVMNDKNGFSEIAFYIKTQFNCDIQSCIDLIINFLKEFVNVRPAKFVSYVAYRICVKYPVVYWNFYSSIVQIMNNTNNLSKQYLTYITELYLYGFPLPSDEFVENIFPYFQKYALTLLPIYYYLFSRKELFMMRHLRKMKTLMNEWIINEKQKLVISKQSLRQNSLKIQNLFIQKIQNQDECNKYIKDIQNYQNCCHQFSLLIQLSSGQPLDNSFKLKSIFQLKKETETFRKDYELPNYEQQLYLQNSPKERILNIFKKSQMLKISENFCFIDRMKTCKTLEQVFDYSGYFLEQMNILQNREQIVEIIIDQCYNFNNLPYIIKFLNEIVIKQPQIKQYCSMKAKKICGYSKMNQKYQKLICEMSKFQIISQTILLDYIDRSLQQQTIQTVKQIQSILENLGTLVYYRSLETHIRINNIFQSIESMIKNRLTQFSMEHLFNVKCLHNYLKNHVGRKKKVQPTEIQQIQIKSNFDFLKRKYQQMLRHESSQQNIVEYMVLGINEQQYLTTYYYASLLKELNCLSLQKLMTQKAIDIIFKNIDQGYNAQRSAHWSRFLGELYTYQIINRKRLLEIFYQILQKYHGTEKLMGALKCIGSALQTSMIYLNQSQRRKSSKQVLKFLLHLKLQIINLDNNVASSIKCQIQDIFQYFHPKINKCLNSQSEIHCLLQFYDQNKNKSIDLSYIIDELFEGQSFQQIQAKFNRKSVNFQKGHHKDRYISKQQSRSSSRIYKQKTSNIKYVEKEQPKQQIQISELSIEISKDFERQKQKDEKKSAQKTQETVSITSESKIKMKILGKTRNGQIKQHTISYQPMTEEKKTKVQPNLDYYL